LIASDPGGRVYVTYYAGPGGFVRGLSFTRSVDGGATWLPQPIELEPVTPRRTRIGFHKLEKDGKGHVFATWSLEIPVEMGRWRTKEVSRRHSSDFGATWSAAPARWTSDRRGLFPTPMTLADGELSLLWTQRQGKDHHLYFSRTHDSGRTWPASPVAIDVLGSEAASPERATKRVRESVWPSMVGDEAGRIFVTWADNRSGLHDIFFSRSLDGGQSWSDRNARLDTDSPGSGHSRFPSIATDGNGGICVLWEDRRHNGHDLYFNSSLDIGETWLTHDRRVTPDRSPQRSSVLDHLLFCDRAGNVYAVWRESWGGPEHIFFNASQDRGATWFLRPRQLDNQGEGAHSSVMSLAYDEAGHVYVVWLQMEEGKADSILLNRSEDFGSTWLPKPFNLRASMAREGATGEARFPRISADGQGRVYVIWSSSESEEFRLFLNRSADYGATWLTSEIQITP